MKKKRLIPVLLLKDGFLVQSRSFSTYRNLGNPVTATKRLNAWGPDEIIYLDISKSDNYDLRRDDIKHPNRNNFLDILEDVARVTFAPITIGGKVRALRDVEQRLRKGADKVSINTKALEEPRFITEMANEFGSQCVVVSMDVKIIDGEHRVMAHGGMKEMRYDPVEWAHIVQNSGAGEILLNSVDRDGQKVGFDIELIDKVSSRVRIPVIALGGAGEWEHFAEVFLRTKADAVAAANLFQHMEQSLYLIKKQLHDHEFPVRRPFISEDLANEKHDLL